MNIVATKNKKEILPWVCAFLLFILTCPKWVWGLGYNILIYASLLLLVIAFKDIVGNKKIFYIGIIGLVCQIVFLTRYFTNSTSNVYGYIGTVITGVGFATIYFCSAGFWQKCIDCFVILLAFLLISALMEHVAISFFGIEVTPPFTQQSPINVDREYRSYFFNVYLYDTDAFFSRFYAFYDEPGVLGNIVAGMLYIQKFNLKKWYNIILFVSGILSFSLAFYIAIIVYYVMFGSARQKLFFIVLFIISTYYFYNNEYVFKYLFGRLEFVDGAISGYNRETAIFDIWIKRISVWDYFLWGYSPREAVPFTASWKWAFAFFGIIPSLVFLFALIYPKAKLIHNKSHVIRGLAFTTVLWTQRPFIFLYIYVFLIAIQFIYEPENTTNNRKLTK